MSEIDIDVGPVRQLVTNKFESSQAFAKDLWNLAEGYLSDLQEDWQPPELDFRDTRVPSMGTDMTEPALPEEPNTNIGFPEEPQEPQYEDISIEDIEIPSLDVVAPEITLPDAPSVTWPEDPGEVPSIEEPDIPTKPSYDLPDVPTFEELEFPAEPEIETISFDAEFPICDLDLPSSIFVFNEPEYETELKNALEQKLKEDIEFGGTGLSVEVEDAIWQRAKDRLSLEYERAYNEVETFFASRGFNVPPGALVGRLDSVIKEHDRSLEQINYEVMIEQAKLAQTNTHFIVTSVIQQEANLMSFFTNKQNRALDAAKYAQEAAIALFNAAVVRYNARLDAYKTSAAVYESRIRATLALLERYKAQLEGVAIKQRVQNMQAELYRTQVAAVSTYIDLYRTEMEACRIRADVERLKLEGFREKVGAYTAKLNTLVSSYNVYQAQIAGEAAKASVYAEQVRAYLGEVSAVRTDADIKLAGINLKLEKNRDQINKLKADISLFNSKVQAKVAEIEAAAAVYGYGVTRYKADIDKGVARIRALAERYKANVAYATSKENVDIARVKAEVDEINRAHELKLEVAKASANVAAQMAASALSAVAAGVQMSMRGTLSGEIGEYYNHNLTA